MNDFTVFDDRVRSVWRYPGGEVGVRAIGQAPRQLLARVQNSDELLALVMYLGACRDAVDCVAIPYLPYARQDRVAVPGDPVAIAVLAQLLASTGVRNFATVDMHSPASITAFAAAGLQLTNLSATPWLDRYLGAIQTSTQQPIVFVAPDKGARQRTGDLARAASRPSREVMLVHCSKLRDPVTGKLAGFAVDRDASPAVLPADALVVVVDDICDGGGTLLGVADAMRTNYGPCSLHLWTTHGLYSKGLDALLDTFTTLGATDSFHSGHQHDRLHLIPLQTAANPS
jgi:ribose-phosphate pyrophosphokinase